MLEAVLESAVQMGAGLVLIQEPRGDKEMMFVRLFGLTGVRKAQ